MLYNYKITLDIYTGLPQGAVSGRYDSEMNQSIAAETLKIDLTNWNLLIYFSRY
jgi:hypothetical protein